MTTFSIIIPCYNAGNHLAKCVESVLGQTYNHHQVILVNDGSADNTGSICDSYRSHENVTVLHQTNKGVSAARNYGMSKATGDYILFADADDCIENNLIETIYNKLKNKKYDAICFGFKRTYSNTGKQLHIPKPMEISGNIAVITKILPNFIGKSLSNVHDWYSTKVLAPNKEWPSVWRFVYRKSIIDEHGIFFDPKISLGEDIIFNSLYLSKIESYLAIDNNLYNYFGTDEGALSTILNDGTVLLKNKKDLLYSREKIRDSILNEHGIDISDYYVGSNVLSTFEILSKTSRCKLIDLIKNYKQSKTFFSEPPIKNSFKKLSVKGAPLKFLIPVYLVKRRLTFVIFFCFFIFNKVGIKLKL